MAIQISMAPAFLLVAISNLINGITATRQRIIDRYRELSAENSDVLIPTDEVEYEKCASPSGVVIDPSHHLAHQRHDVDCAGDFHHLHQLGESRD